MKRLPLAILLTLGMGSSVWADAISLNVDTTTLARRTRIVVNNSGAALTSRTVVIWDNDGVNATSTAFDRNGYPYVTTTTSADSIWVAGVTTDASCADQALCEIVVEGPAITRIAQNADVIAEDTLVATTTVAGQAGDYAPAANTGCLGVSMELRQADTGATTGLGASNNIPMWVFVDPCRQ